MDNKETVCAVVVTYNRKNLLLECLEALLKQTRPIDAIYIIDNASTDKTPELLLEKGYIQELPPKELNEPWEKKFMFNNNLSPITNHKLPIFYVRMNENTGGAGGFYEGVKRAYEKGYDWLWLMDDDAEPYIDSLEILLHYKEKSMLLCPLIIGKRDIQSYHHKRYKKKLLKEIKWSIDINKQYYIIDANAFVGPLIHKEIIKNIGFPEKDFFIWSDDTEYTFRANEYTNILLITKAKINHKDEQFVNNKVNINALWKQYYGYRNKILSIKKHAKSRLKHIYIIGILFYSIYDSIKYLRHYFNFKAFLHFKGAMDGIKNIKGKIIDPKKFNENL